MPRPNGPTRAERVGTSAMRCGAPGAMPSRGWGPRAWAGFPPSTSPTRVCRPPTPRAGPADWFSHGLLRGFGLPNRPLLLFTPEVKTREPLALLRGRGIDAVHAVELPPALLRTRDIAALKRLVFEEND